MSPRDLRDFLGTWHLERDIRHGDGTIGRFSGQASWRPDVQGALYVESGALYLGIQGPFHAERRYRWGEDLEVFFEDGRFFHQVPAAGGSAEHWCPPDMYRARYCFASWPAWQAVWSVSGPKKAYTMTSRYRREAG